MLTNSLQISPALTVQEVRRRQKLIDKYWDPAKITELYLRVVEGRFSEEDYNIIVAGIKQRYPSLSRDYLEEVKQIKKSLGREIEPTGKSLPVRSPEQVKAYIRKMGFDLEKVRFGYAVNVDTMDGKGWHYWRPTRETADAVGRARLFQEVAKVEDAYGLKSTKVNSVVRKTAYDIHPSYVPSDTEQWDQEFQKAQTSDSR